MKKIKATTFLLIFCIVALVLSACNPGEKTPVLSEEDLQAQVLATTSARATQFAVETMAAQLTALSMPTNTPVPTEVPTQAPPPTQVPPTAVMNPEPAATATSAPQPTTPPVESGTQCLQMAFVADVTIPAGTVMKPGEKFDKTWTIKNTGTCTWTTDYDLILIGGEAFGSNKLGDLKFETPPGDTVDITLFNLVAPQTEGTYYSYWMLKHPDGARFGYGPNREWSLGITIEVKK